ncbi:hypothetical protein J2W48_001916 [Flavobacterium piscis]|uniref:Uncharacterized protein n=1 Tax=Flavobacterium piscis TaxID=1114874 RepID=A0ABU1Y6W6_9FLAO|nr:hypothetical protein [Flavobacterium piscis]
MYAPYGVAIKKDLIFELGGRPIIYGLPEEKEYLHESIVWRFESAPLHKRIRSLSLICI